jgi:type II secretory pathway component PulF
MDRTLLQLADHFEHRVELRRSLLSSLFWPLLQLFAAIVVVSILIYILGVLTPAGGGEMPDILGFGLSGGRGVLVFWAYVAGFLGGLYALYWGYRNNIGGVQNLIPLVYKIPVLGPALQTITLARFSWTLSLCLDAGLDPIQSVGLSLESTDSDFYRAGGKDAEACIRQGKSLAESLAATYAFPKDFLGQVELAELSGTDAESMGGLAREYDARARIAMKTLSNIASGAIWVSIVVFILFLIFQVIINGLGDYYGTLNELVEETN